ncbi:hypothetical protein F5146DRAFT_1003345 [Armillaria mellea]|nr:hypothetical protein F5146DRAFT_1003345 [Armillaria mellea]
MLIGNYREQTATLAIVRPIVEFPQGDALRAGHRPGPDWTPKRSRRSREERLGLNSKLYVAKTGNIVAYNQDEAVSRCHVSEEMKGGGPYGVCAYNDLTASKRDVILFEVGRIELIITYLFFMNHTSDSSIATLSCFETSWDVEVAAFNTRNTGSEATIEIFVESRLYAAKKGKIVPCNQDVPVASYSFIATLSCFETSWDVEVAARGQRKELPSRRYLSTMAKGVDSSCTACQKLGYVGGKWTRFLLGSFLVQSLRKFTRETHRNVLLQ